ncbi:MAG: MFS transporter [Ilumatobacteraceae bacterium]
MSTGRPRWGALALVCGTYFAATVGEQLLSPLFPTTREDLGLSEGQGGVAFGVLALAIAVFNMVSGAALRRWSAITVIRVGTVVTAAGAAVAATADGFAGIVVAQALLGAGAGLFFPAGLQAVAIFAGATRRGFAMGIYGVAFSIGLAVSALLGAIGASAGWRLPFWIAVGLAVSALIVTSRMSTEPPVRGARWSLPWRAVLGLPTIVGTVGAILQYGVLAFFATYAVDVWDLSEARAAGLLAIGRVVSIVAKVIGGASTDRIGPRASVLRTGVLLSVTGVLWVVLPGGIATYGIAALFAGTVSSIFPAANVLAVERFGGNGLALGAYRSIQIGIGALAGVLIGNSPIGLRWTVLVCVLVPLSLLWFCRPPRTADDEVQTAIAAP